MPTWWDRRTSGQRWLMLFAFVVALFFLLTLIDPTIALSVPAVIITAGLFFFAGAA